MKRLVIYPYKFGSKSGKVLRDTLPAVRVRDTGRYRKRENDFVINWGNTRVPSWGNADINNYDAVARACDKIVALQTMKEAGVRTVEFTTNRTEVGAWLEAGDSVYSRTLTRGHAGNGIIISNSNDEIPDAPLYTRGIESNVEYRVHVFNGKAIDYAKKIPLEGSELTVEVSKIKSHSRGWTFARNVKLRPSVQEEAVKAVTALGLDFGAVDIIINPKNKNRPHVLEVNTSPGLEEGGRTLDIYVEAITNYVQQKETEDI
jgi:glutathione synthase/RimK-type ligase-like ATP-grasp enzyme